MNEIREAALRAARSQSIQTQLNDLLSCWFEEKKTRTDHFVFDPAFCSEPVYVLACALYKRGVKATHKVTGETLPNVVAKFPFFPTFVWSASTLPSPSSTEFCIVDSKVRKLHPQYFASRECIEIDAEEGNKNLQLIFDIIQQLPPQTSSLLAAGGGLTSDVVGCIAALTDLPFDIFPTTLLSLVDASVGGKTGVNHPRFGKNQLGAFYTPRRLYFSTETLATLSWDEVLSGLGEVLKHAWLMGYLDEWLPCIEMILDSKKLTPSPQIDALVLQNIAIKSAVVLSDPWEKNGQRSLLNLGHTIGHVIESLGTQSILSPVSHGISVLKGMRALKTGGHLLGQEHFWDVTQRCLGASQPAELQNIKRADFLQNVRLLLSADKKTKVTNQVELICPEYGILSKMKDENTSVCLARRSVPLDDALVMTLSEIPLSRLS